ncbi:MAG: ArnT family glycosyltransferase [Nitrospinota bacterium]
MSIALKTIVLGSYFMYFAITGWFLWFVLQRDSFQEPQNVLPPTPVSIWTTHRSLVFLFALVFGLHFVFALIVPESYYASDESYHAFLARSLLEKADKMFQVFLHIPFLWIWRGFVLALALMTVLFWKRVTHFCKESFVGLFRPKVAFAVALGLAAWNILILTSAIPATIDLFVFPQLGRLLYLVSYAFFGTSVVSGRLVQMAFAFAGGILIYHLTRLYWNQQTAALACSVYILLPIAFHFGHTGDYASGTLLFLILIGYCFLRFEKTQRPQDLLMAIYFVGLGYNYKRVIVISLFAFWLLWALSSCRQHPHEIREGLSRRVIYSCLALVPILPAYFTDRIFSERIAGYRFGRLLDLRDLTLMFQVLPREVSPVIFVFFLAGTVWCLWRHRNVWVGYLLIWFVVFYLFFTVWYNLSTPRYMLYFVPPVAMLAAVALGEILGKLKSKKVTVGVVGMLMVNLIYSSVPWGWPPRERERFSRTVSAEERQWNRQLVDRTLERVRRVWKGNPLKPKMQDEK